MTSSFTGLAQSVQARLVRHAHETGVETTLVITRYAMERFLYRLSRSPHADRFVLKGGLLLLVWCGEAIRPTRDADLLGLGDLSDSALIDIFGGVCETQVEPDAMVFLADSLQVAPIRAEDTYGGKRVTVLSRLGPARIRTQLDIGIGDAVVPEPELIDYPSLLGLPGARLLAYRPETAIAEKLHAVVEFGAKNSRMRDYFDLLSLCARRSFDGRTLVAAVQATFGRRRTPIPESLPHGLTSAFASSQDKRAQWAGFLKKNGLATDPADLQGTIAKVALFLGPVIEAAHLGSGVGTWPPGGPWQSHGPADP